MDRDELKDTFNELERLTDSIKDRLETVYSRLEDVLDEGILMKIQDAQQEVDEVHDMVVEEVHKLEDEENEAAEDARREAEDKEKIDRVLEEKEKDGPKE